MSLLPSRLRHTALLLALWSGSTWASTITVDMLDVGQGDALVIRTEDGKTVLIDAGEGKTPVVPLLQSLGVTSLDLVVATHPHADHIGGMQPVIEAFPVKLYIDNGIPHTTTSYDNLMKAIEERKIPYKSAAIGQTYKLGKDLELDVLFPGKVELRGTRSDINSNSVVLRMDHGKGCMLFLGDAEEPTETRLVNGNLKPCEVLKVAHHGGNHSTTDALLKAARPKVAVISVGVGNRYGHPGPETLERLAHQGVTVYRTDQSGNLRLLFDEDSIEVLEGVEIGPKPAQGPTAAPAPTQATTQKGAP